MKRFLQTDGWLAACVLSAFLLAGFAGCGGCAAGKGTLTPSTGVYDETAAADVAVVSAQNIREAALGIFEAFMRVEKENDAALRAISPKIHETAEVVRRDGAKYLDALTAATTAYQNARTPENASRLKSALAAVNSLLISATKQLAEATTRKAP